MSISGPTPNYQSGWKWCNRCGVLYFPSNCERCASTGAGHAAAGSGTYKVPDRLLLGTVSQSGWRWCCKCSTMHFGTGANRCPAGGSHDDSRSGEYTMFHNYSAAGIQTGWRWCRICSVLFFAGGGSAGTCAGGGGHDSTGSGDYGVSFA